MQSFLWLFLPFYFLNSFKILYKNIITTIINISIFILLLRFSGAVKTAPAFLTIFRDFYRNRKKTIIYGNGGPASDALHFAAELVNRFERTGEPSLPSLYLKTYQQ
jgi:phosphoheptose isomerase